MNNPYDVDEIRKMMPVVAAEQEMNYIGYLSNEIDTKTLLLDLRIHVEQLRQRVVELEQRTKSMDRCLRYVIGGSAFFALMLCVIARICWWH